VLASFEMALGWWDKPHHIVAKIAQDHLEMEDSFALSKANDLLDVLRNSSDVKIPALKKEDKHSFVECATFADIVKGR